MGGSYDPDGDAILDYDWTLDAAPAESSLTGRDVDTPDDPSPTFIPDVAGTFVLGLEVEDFADDSLLSTVALEVESRGYNHDPVADAGIDQAGAATTTCSETAYGYSCADCSELSFTLDGTGSTDVDGDTLRYTWSTDGVYAVIIQDTSAQPVLVVSGLEGEMGLALTQIITVSLELRDCMNATSSDTMQIVYTCAEAPEDAR